MWFYNKSHLATYTRIPRLYDRLAPFSTRKLCRFREQHSDLVIISTRQPFLGSRSPSSRIYKHNLPQSMEHTLVYAPLMVIYYTNGSKS